MTTREATPTAHARLAAAAPGAFLVVLGLAGAGIATGYRLGTPAAMGPGFFPVMVGLALAVLGGASAVESARAPQRLAAPPVRALTSVSAGVLAWALLVEPLGFFAAGAALVAASAFAKPPVRPVSVVLLAAILGAAGFVLFVVQLGVPLTAFGRR